MLREIMRFGAFFRGSIGYFGVKVLIFRILQ